MLLLGETVLLSLVMFNLLIAIISKTYEVFEEEKKLKDTKELFEILKDISAIADTISWFVNTGDTPGYIHTITESDVSNEELQEILEAVQSKLNLKFKF